MFMTCFSPGTLASATIRLKCVNSHFESKQDNYQLKTNLEITDHNRQSIVNIVIVVTACF